MRVTTEERLWGDGCGKEVNELYRFRLGPTYLELEAASRGKRVGLILSRADSRGKRGGCWENLRGRLIKPRTCEINL